MAGRWERLRLGMPHLGARGLAEGWFLRHCGDRHWRLLEHHLGVKPSETVTADGRRVYASFVAYRWEGHSTRLWGEDDTIEIRATLARHRLGLFSSRHTLLHLGRGEHATLELLSAFVRRYEADDNGLFVRDESGAWLERGLVPDRREHALRLIHRQWREELLGDMSDAIWIGTFEVCPTADFNAAGFLYFANYSRFVDQAAWAWRPTRGLASSALSARTIAFYGNLNGGDGVSVALHSAPADAGEAAHTAVLRRRSDRGLLAVVQTRRFIGLDAEEEIGVGGW